MKHAELRFYAELNDLLAPELRYRTFTRSFDVSPTVKEMTEGMGVPHTEVDLVIANGESVPFSYRVQDGDRISVYPVFESFDISPALRLRPSPLRDPRFVLDTHLGQLARHLRVLGVDALHGHDLGDAELTGVSASEGRILLTRDARLLQRPEITRGYHVRADEPRRQLAEVVQRFDLSRALALEPAVDPSA